MHCAARVTRNIRSIRVFRSIAVIGIGLAAVTGCAGHSPNGSSNADSSSEQSRSAAMTPTVSSPSSSSAPSAVATSRAVPPIVLKRIGGLAGTDDQLRLRPDTSYTVTTRVTTRQGGGSVTRRLSPRQLAAIRAAVRATDFGRLPTDSTGQLGSAGSSAAPVIVDGYRYILIVGEDTFTWAEPVPKPAQPLVDALSALLPLPALTGSATAATP